MSYLNKLGLGGAKLGSVSGLASSASKKLLETAYGEGIRFFDTANIYGQGDSERFMGCLLLKDPELVIGTKGGYTLLTGLVSTSSGSGVKLIARAVVSQMGFLKKWMIRYRTKKTSTQDYSYEALLNAASASAKRLNVDCLPLYMLHSPSIEELKSGVGLMSLQKLKREGRVSRTGLALLNVSDIDHIKDVAELDYIQVGLNLLSAKSDFEKLKSFKAKTGVVVVVRQPFAGGLLLHDIKSDDDVRVLKLSKCAVDEGMSLEVLSLLTLLHCPFVDKVIVGTTKESHLRRNIDTAKMSLSDTIYTDVMKIIEGVSL